ncbi:MAG: SAM-dependent methyltransferase [Myxococcales bacterium]
MAHCCHWWLAYTFDQPLRRLVQNPERLLGPWLRPGMTALDVGCGMGFFSIPMARLASPGGRVVSVDLQPQMLEVLMRRARRAGVADAIRPRLASRDSLNVEERIDFALAMWMVHEVEDRGRLFAQLAASLAPDGRLLVAEPKVHVTKRAFEESLRIAEEQGLAVVGRPRVGLSRAALFARRTERG